MRRTAGLLVPGFTKSFDAVAGCGVTWWLGIRIGAFDVVRLPDRARVRVGRGEVRGEPARGGTVERGVEGGDPHARHTRKVVGYALLRT